MLKGIRGATLANYQLCAFKEHYQHKDCNYTHTRTVFLHTLYRPCFRRLLPNCLLDCCCPLFLNSSPFCPFIHGSQDSLSLRPCSIFPACFHFLPSVYPSPSSKKKNSSLSAPLSPLFLSLLLLPAPLPPPGPKQTLK